VGSPPSDQPVLRLRLGDAEHSLLAPRTLIGRSRSCDVRLKDDTVSRLHAAFMWRGNLLTLEDLGSSNGTWHNGARVTDTVAVQAGDALRFGSVDAVVESPGATPAARPGPPPAAPPAQRNADYTVGVVPGRLAGPGRRAFAALLDLALFAAGSLVPFGPLVAVLLSERFLLAPNAIPPSLETRTTIALGCTALWLGYAWYYVVHGWARRGGTPGLRLAGLRLADGALRTPVGYGRAWRRLLGLLATAATLGLGFATMVRREDRRALHDVIAGTLVVHRPRAL